MKDDIEPNELFPEHPQMHETVHQLLDQITKRNQHLLWLRTERERLLHQVAEKEQAVQTLSARVAEKEQVVQALSAQVAEKEQTARALSAQVAEKNQVLGSIYRSRHWKMMEAYWNARWTTRQLIRSPYQTFRQWLRRAIPYEWRRRILLHARRWLPFLRPENEWPIHTAISTLSPEDFPLVSSTSYDVICFANIDWRARYQRPQQMMSHFGKHGHRVFYVVASRFVNVDDEKGFRAMAVDEGVLEVNLRGSGSVNFYWEAMTEDAEKLMVSSLVKLRQEFQIKSAVSVVHLSFWTPLALQLRERWGWPVIYDCMDEWGDFPNIGQALLEQEVRLVEESDIVTVTAALLEEKWHDRSKRCLLVRNGVDFKFFSRHSHPNDLLKNIEHPVIGYYGALAEWVDFDLLRFLATERPDWHFVLIGDTFTQDLAGIDTLPNVHLLGRRPYTEMPLYLYHFDVCLIPFKLNDVTHAVDPVKFYEFISVGKPVVAVPLSELLIYDQYLYLADTPQEFLNRIEAALAENDPDLIDERIALAKENEWSEKYQRVHQAIVNLYNKVSIIIVTYHNVDLTRECVESILRNTTWPNYEIIIIDNHSQDGTRNYLRYLDRKYENIKILLNNENRGFAAANNQGLQVAEGGYLVLLNNDTVVPRGWLTSLLKHLHDPKVGLVGPVTNFAGNQARIDATYTTLEEMETFADEYTRQHEGEVFDISMLAMFCIAMRRDTFEAVGFLDEGFRTGMFEDDDYSYRIKEKGYRIICVRDTFVHHVGQAAFKRLLASGEYKAVWDANQAYFESKWGVKWQALGDAAKPDNSLQEDSELL